MKKYQHYSAGYGKVQPAPRGTCIERVVNMPTIVCLLGNINKMVLCIHKIDTKSIKAQQNPFSDILKCINAYYVSFILDL